MLFQILRQFSPQLLATYNDYRDKTRKHPQSLSKRVIDSFLDYYMLFARIFCGFKNILYCCNLINKR